MKPPSPAPPPTFDPRHAWRHTLGAARADGALALVLLASAVLFAFRGVLGNGLVMWDDNLYREQIPQLQEWSGGNLLWMLTDRSWFYWHPLAYAWHAAENALFGADHRGPQAAAIALHALNAGWVLVLGCAFLGPRRGDPAPPSAGAVLGASLAAAALWALHPLRVESVAWMAEKKDLLCAFLSFAATAAWLLRATLPAGAPRGRWTAATFALFVLALAAKPLAVALPAAWLVVDLALLEAHRRPGGLRAALLDKAPFLLLGLAAAAAGATGEKQHDRISEPLSLGSARLLTPLWGFAAPLVRTVLPFGLSPMEEQYPRSDITLLSLRWGGSLLLLGCLTLLAIRSRRRGGWALPAAWFAYLALAAPVSGIRQLANLATADRFSYTATVPLWLLAGGGLLLAGRTAAARAGPAGAGRVAAVAAALPILLAAGTTHLTVRQTGIWRDPETLWTAALEAGPRSEVLPRARLGAWFALRAGREGDPALWARAEEQFRASLRAEERNPTVHNNLGFAREARGDRADAERHYRRAVELAPSFSFARANLARLLLRTGRREEAEREWREAASSGGWIHPGLRAEMERALAGPGKR